MNYSPALTFVDCDMTLIEVSEVLRLVSLARLFGHVDLFTIGVDSIRFY